MHTIVKPEDCDAAMNEINVTLTDADRAILDSYCAMLDGLSAYLGSAYEIVLHSLEDYEHSAIKVLNGFHTGRTVGAPLTDLAIAKLKQIRLEGENSQGVVYFTRNRKGDPMKSATVPVKGCDGRIIGLLCINFYMNTSLAELLSTLGAPGAFDGEQAGESPEYFSANSRDLLGSMIAREKQRVFEDRSISASAKNKEVVRHLYERGAFSMKDSVAEVARILGLSKNTVYLHLRNLDKQGE